MAMLPNEALDKAAGQLAEYRRQDTLTEILEQYSDLIESYKRLKSDYEEEREGRERYKQLARGQERNPFALVVIDGDGYIFDDNFITAKEEGGSKAAQALNEAIRASLRRKGLESCEILIRVYANLVGLSKCLSKNGLSGADKRSLAPFVGGFNRSYGLTDFVDAGELKENADHKLKAILRLYADNAQCKQIYFAACHDVGYVADLTPYRGNSERFTLIRTPSLRFHPEFSKLGLTVEDLTGVFRTIPLAQPSVPQPSMNATLSTSSLKSITSSPTASYVPPMRSSSSRFDNNSASSMRSNWREKDYTETGNRTYTTSTPYPSASNIDSLPKEEEIPEGYVALNAARERLDAYITPPTPDGSRRLKALSVNNRKLCNNQQLTGYCSNGDSCEYDHTPIPADLKPVLESLSRSMPCSRKGTCRKANCVQGHVCQKSDCKHRGGKGYCRFPHNVCLGDYKADSFVPAIMSRRPMSRAMSWEDDPEEKSPALSDDDDGAGL